MSKIDLSLPSRFMDACVAKDKDEVKYLGHGNWEIKEWNWSE